MTSFRDEEITYGHITITIVHPDMIRIFDENKANAVTIKEWEFVEYLEDVLERAM